MRVKYNKWVVQNIHENQIKYSTCSYNQIPLFYFQSIYTLFSPFFDPVLLKYKVQIRNGEKMLQTLVHKTNLDLSTKYRR